MPAPENNDTEPPKSTIYIVTSALVAAASPEYIIEGELDFSELVDLTASKTSSLRQNIESNGAKAEALEAVREQLLASSEPAPSRFLPDGKKCGFLEKNYSQTQTRPDQ